MEPNKDNNSKQEKKPSKFKKIKKIIKKFGMLAPLLKPLIAILMLSSVLSTVIYTIASIFAKETPEQIYEQLEVDDLTDFVVIKGDEENGYHLEFLENADEKLELLSKNLENTTGVKMIDKELLKKMIQAEAITQYPDLGGTITDPNTQFQGNVKVRRVTPNKTIGELKDTSSGEKTSQDIIQIVDDAEKDVDHTNTKSYVIGIMAAYSQDSPGGRSPTPEGKEKQLKEEEMTIKVANYIQQLFSIYSNIKVVQIGSTIDNPNVSDENRLQTAKEAGVDALIGINFNSFGDGTSYNNTNGVEITYNKDGGTEKTKEFGKILKEKVTANMNLSKGVDNEEESKVLGTKDDSFISLMIHGGYLTSKRDYAVLSTDRGLQNYARGVVDAILEYYEISNIGYGAIISGTTTIASTIDSMIYDLTYVPLDVFESHLESDPQKAINEFSLDESKRLVTATWKYNDEGVEVIRNFTSLDYKSVIGKYTMPFEYLLFFYIDTNKRDFIMNLADLALSSEYIITVQDNITTTKVTEITTTTKNTYKKQQNEESEKEIWHKQNTESDKDTKITVTEACTTKLELTYADTWFMKFKTEFMSQNDSNTTKGMNGKVTSNQNQSENSDIKTSYRYVTENGEHQAYKDETKTIISTETVSISNQYETGKKETVEDEKKFVEIYTDEETGVRGLTKEKWLFQYIEENPKTANMLDLTKYLLYKATGEDYGVMTYDFEQYDSNTFNTTTGIYAGTVEEKVWFTLKAAGYREHTIAGVMGNMYQECTFNPAAIQTGVDNAGWKGIGLIQWTEGRKEGLKGYANSLGKTWDDPDVQIQYLLGEFQKANGANGYATYQWSGYTKYENQWLNATTASEAAEAFCLGFERAGNAHMSTRTSKAEEYYLAFKGKEPPARGEFDCETVTALGYTFPHYLQRNYTRGYGSSTISKSGCGPTSLAMILAGLKGDESITPMTLVDNLEAFYPSYNSYYLSGVGSKYDGLCNSTFLSTYYGVTSTPIGSTQQGLDAIAAGKCAIARVTGHVLAIVPLPDEYKNSDYQFYVMDSGRGLDGPYRSIDELNAQPKSKGGFNFQYIIEL